MEFTDIVIALVIVSLVTTVVLWGTRYRNYGRIMATSHLIELAKALIDIRRAAPDQEHREPVRGEVPPNARITSAYLALLYTVHTEGDVCHHHLSLSWRGQGFPKRLAVRCIGYTLEVLSLTPDRVDLDLGKRGVYHLTWRLDPTAHREFLEREIPVPGRIEAGRHLLNAAPHLPDLQKRLQALQPPA